MAAAPGRSIPRGRGDLGRVDLGSWVIPPFSSPHLQLAACRCGGLHPALPPFPRPSSLGGTRAHPSEWGGGEAMQRPPRSIPVSMPVSIPVFALSTPPAPCGCRSGAGRGEGGGGGGGEMLGGGKRWGVLAQPPRSSPRLPLGPLGPCGRGSPGWIYPEFILDYPSQGPPCPVSQVRSEHQNLGVPSALEAPPGVWGSSPAQCLGAARGWRCLDSSILTQSWGDLEERGGSLCGPFGVRGPGGSRGTPPRAAAASDPNLGLGSWGSAHPCAELRPFSAVPSPERCDPAWAVLLAGTSPYGPAPSVPNLSLRPCRAGAPPALSAGHSCALLSVLFPQSVARG